MQVQKDIREGHAETVAKVLRMIDAEGGIKGRTCCDVGCGTGSLSIPLVSRVRPPLPNLLNFLLRRVDSGAPPIFHGPIFFAACMSTVISVVDPRANHSIHQAAEALLQGSGQFLAPPGEDGWNKKGAG